MPLRRHSVGTYQDMSSHTTCQGTTYSRPQLSQLAEPLWTGPGLKSGISVCDLLQKKKKKKQAENELSNIVPGFSHSGRKPPPPPHVSIAKSHYTGKGVEKLK